MKTTREGCVSSCLEAMNGQAFELLSSEEAQTDGISHREVFGEFCQRGAFLQKTDPSHSWRHVEDLIARALSVESQCKR